MCVQIRKSERTTLAPLPLPLTGLDSPCGQRELRPLVPVVVVLRLVLHLLGQHADLVVVQALQGRGKGCQSQLLNLNLKFKLVMKGLYEGKDYLQIRYVKYKRVG